MLDFKFVKGSRNKLNIMNLNITQVLFLLLFICNTSSSCIGQWSVDDHKVFLLGNLENLDIQSEAFLSLARKVKNTKTTYTVLVNGDFVGPKGLSESPKSSEVERLEALMALGSDQGKVIFIPGDKEWDDSGDDGKKKLAALEKYLDKKGGDNVEFYPRNNCLGPELLSLNEHVQLLTINTQWLLQDNRIEEEDGKCKFLTDRELWSELTDLLIKNDNKNLIVAIHHPIVSYGQYAGCKLGAMHWSPPIYGTFKAAFHRNIGGAKDLQNEELAKFRNRLHSITEDIDGVIFTSGHEYDLQVIKSDGNYHINSGSFVQSRPVDSKEGTLFSKNAKGYIELDLKGNGEVLVTALKAQNGNFNALYSQQLFTSPCEQRNGISSLPNPSYNPCAQKESIDYAVDIPEPGVAVASTDYKNGPGKLYRSIWELPIDNIPYLDIGTYEGGLRLYKAGGAGETSSLKFKTKDGRKIAFRSVDKNPQTRFNSELENSVVGRTTKDLIAHQHPYGSLVAKVFADKFDLTHTDPELYIMPDDPRLGVYQEKFAGMLGTLEKKPYDAKDGKPGSKGATKIVSSFKMYKKLLNGKNVKFDQESYIYSRLLDMWMGDWDRHDDNWAWLEYRNEEETLYKAFPKDKDKVFAVFDGIYKVMDWEYVTQFWSAFKDDYKGLKRLNYHCKDKDRWLLSSLTQEDWNHYVHRFLTAIDEPTIDKALSNMPPEVQAMVSSEMKERMLLRKDLLPAAMDEYYQLLAKSIYVVGTNNRERFDLVRQPNGDVQVDVYQVLKSGDKKKSIYSRLVKESETEEIILFGLGKKDIFEISGSANEKLAIRIVGGAGKDKITDISTVPSGKATFVYAKNEKDEMYLGETGKYLNTEKDIVFNTQNVFNYDYGFIIPSIGYNAEDGINLGVIRSSTKQEFAKEDFGSQTHFSANITSNLNASMRYKFVKRRIGTPWDLLLEFSGNSRDRSHQHFYGFGNETSLDENLFADGFYRNDTKLLATKIGLNKQFWNKSSITPSVRIEYKDVGASPKNEEASSVYDQFQSIAGFGINTLLGTDVELLIDFTDSKNLPRDGTRFQLNNFVFYNTQNDLDLGGRLDLEASFYLSAGDSKRLTLGLRGGYSTTYGDVPFYQLSTVGQRYNNRGFRRNRFVGNSAAFYNTELRYHLGNINNAIIPIRVGIFGLYDSGRVWLDGESSNAWHNSYGGGLYFVPYVESFSINVTFARNDEDGNLLSFGLGALL